MNWHDAVQYIFWGSLGLVAYSYVGYPLLLAVISSVDSLFRPKERARDGDSPIADLEPVDVGVVIAAFNEERDIRNRVENLLSQDFPAGRLKIYVGSDGSTDRTNEVLRTIQSDRVKVFCFESNRGKASVLNDMVAQAVEPVLVLTDANTEFSRDALRWLVRPFSDADVGCVCGDLSLKKSAGDNQDSIFWRAEKFLKSSEGRLGALLGANGGIYAIRRALYSPLPPDTIIDDFIIAMRIKSGGRKLVYEPRARAFEETPAGMDDEFGRRRRIGIGNYQALFRYPEFFWSNGISTKFSYFSHKILRWFTPHLLVIALLSGASLAENRLYGWLTLLQVLGYATGWVLYRARPHVRMRGPVAAAVYLLTLNAAFAVAFLVFVTGRAGGSWKRTARN